MRNVDYDDDDRYDEDDYYDEDEADGNTEDDKEHMRVGTIGVRAALGDFEAGVSDAQIQEALWHYYYDVGKSVSYLKNKLGGTNAVKETPKKEKILSKFDQAAVVAGERAPTTTGKYTHLQHSIVESAHPATLNLPPREMPTYDADDFFWDIPWGKVPAHRVGSITVDPPRHRIGLLGGSKLAALAAKRRKEREEAEATAKVASAGDADAAIAMLDKLSVTGPRSGTSQVNGATRRYPARKRTPSPEPQTSAEEPVEEPKAPQSAIVIENPAKRASASTFASTLCGAAKATHPIAHFSMPYVNLKRPETVKAFEAPSPDDVVRTAQAKGAAGTTPKKKRHSNGDKIAEATERLSVVDEPRVRSKNLNVVAEFENSDAKRIANFVVVGHVDHGKSTLMGRLLLDLKVIDQRSIDKLRKEADTIGKSSFALAWVMDETSEERSRGVTVDIATNYFETEKTRFTILDAPGHKDFIPNMISGASQADFPVLVIDASTNSFESGLKGQTKEHILIARSMGMQHIIVAVNKMDTVAWSKSRFDEISKRMTSFLTEASFLEKRITFIPLAGLTGENVVKKVDHPAADWYSGETLLEALERIDLPQRNLQNPLRLSVADVFRGDLRSPLSIAGRVESGTLQVGDVILALPANERAIIKAIEVQDQSVDWAVAGQITTLHLTDIDPVHLRQGDILCPPKAPVKLVKAFSSKMLAFEHVLPCPVEVFRSTLNSPGSIRTLSAKLNKFTGEVVKRRPRIVRPGEVARVVVLLERELPIEEGMRVVIRERGRTIGAGLMENVA
ncbi:P-loop containing nucleoside triphosphate hydrolase protein [Paraphoma chrysanthemicola]|uniref:Elongation factor 1 alpha-like protein n=1 Tax=Paraphoma chrysanthemicola TaxID=798071 RepID=A0A8K0QWZ5_9PLEO|nr:P-loop containing nucleoside triphosphate hydrolase protein [Paraphoma chrysanthemicola]